MCHVSVDSGWEKAPGRVVFSLCEAKAADGKDRTWPGVCLLGHVECLRNCGLCVGTWGGWSDHVLRLGVERCPA